jgi:two-component system, chemotaxis family, CheB/CheR fusion protein
MNTELRERSHELDDVNAFLETILTSMGIGVAVLDTAGDVRVWNAHSEELWGLRPEEAEGRHLLSLDIGLPLEAIGTDLRAVLAGRAERTSSVLDATNRRGKPIRVRASLLPYDGGATGAILVVEPLDA